MIRRWPIAVTLSSLTHFMIITTLPGRVAGAFADAIDGAFHWRAMLDRGNGVGVPCQIVVAVDRDDRLVHVGTLFIRCR